jgi:GT2 family glycosyltransferase
MLVDFVPGACALLRCSAIESIGGFDERYFMYLEDAELGLRLQRSGFRLVALPWARARHSGSSASGGGASPLRKFLMAANTPRFLRTARSPRLWLSFVCFDVLAWPLVAGVSLLRGRGLASPLAKARGIVWGLRGHRPGPADVQHYLGSRS